MMPDLVWPLIASGALAIGFSVGAWSASRNRKKRLLTAWKVQLEERVHNALEAHLYAAECEVRLAEMVTEVPKDFVAPVFKAMRLGHAVERAVLTEASRLGLASVLEGISPKAEKILHDEGAEIRRAPLEETAEESGPSALWTEGKLVPQRLTLVRRKGN